MQLKRLEAYGFKSFADKIEIEFDHGVTAIVGPNGSGKSNITDAIRWVLGEQNVRNLRGTKSEDIIFTGSSSRKPLGVAEVTLTLLNDGDLSLPYDEITVTRRLFRSGESEFFINKAKCRLKDIYALFADTGLGHDGISVISQNKMDDILNSRPEERRLFFEETAGITKFRDRKHESVRKLEDTETNLVRVTDIINEIEAQLLPLEKEAERTEKYNAWNEQYNKGKITEIYRKIEHIHELDVLEKEKKSQKEQIKISFTAELRNAEAHKEKLEKDILSLDLQIQEKNQEKNQISGELESLKSNILLMEQKAQQENQEYRRLQESIESIEQELVQAEEEKNKLCAIETKYSSEYESLKTKFDAEQHKSTAFSNKIRAKKTELQEMQSKHELIKQQIAEKQNEKVILQKDIESNEAAHVKNEAAYKLLCEEIKAEKEKFTKTEQSLQNIQNKLTEYKQIKEKSLIEQRAKKEKLNAMQQQFRIDEQFVTQGTAKLGVLEHMQQAYEGFGRAVKSVLLAKETWRSNVHGAVAELIRVDSKYLAAVEAALGASQQNLVVKDSDTAKKAIDYLKRVKAGRVTFLPLTDLVVKNHPDESVRNMHGVIGYLDEIVTTQESYQKAVSFLLSRTLLIDTFEHAMHVARNKGFKLRIVTLSGEILNPGGSLSGGSIQQKDSGYLNRGNEIARLKHEIQDRQKSLSESADVKKILLHDIKQLEDSAFEAKEKIETERIHEAEFRVAFKQLQDKITEDNNRADALKKVLSAYSDNYASVQNRCAALKQEIVSMDVALKKQVQELRNITDALDDLEQDASEFSKWLHHLEIQKVGLEHEVLRSHEHVLLSQKKISNLQTAQTENNKNLLEIRDGIQKGQNDTSQLVAKKEIVQKQFAELDSLINSTYTQKMNVISQSKECEEKAQDIRKSLQAVQDELHLFDIEESKRQFNLEQFESTLRDEYGLSLLEASEQLLEIDDDALLQLLKKLKSDISKLGTVNLNAIEDYHKQKERYDFLKAQADDLYNAKENLMKIIAEIDLTMTKQFKIAFVQIQQHFNDIFVSLFGGGHAELSLTNDKDVLHSGVEINVQLPEKKQQNLSVLSGGERALTVIALLFAFLKVRPAPFSVLDEIDAPLDEANIMRFGKFLRDISRQTQFVVVTHRKGTMESADVMYGVTLEDAGVSKILSVKLDDIAG